jgi:hypothetical protein
VRFRRFLESNSIVFWVWENIEEPACESRNGDEDTEESDEEAGH